ncbi:MAG: hypothetical protein LBS14_01165 [Holosporaceae bacterium]|nr:hypothetical protein [Holosporaceae bacterium]
MKRISKAVCLSSVFFCLDMSLAMRRGLVDLPRNPNPSIQALLANYSNGEGSFQELEPGALSAEDTERNAAVRALLEQKKAANQAAFLYVGLSQIDSGGPFYEGPELLDMKRAGKPDADRVVTVSLEAGPPDANHVRIDLRNPDLVNCYLPPGCFSVVAFGAATVGWMGWRAFSNLFPTISLGGQMVIQFTRPAACTFLDLKTANRSVEELPEALLTPIRRVEVRKETIVFGTGREETRYVPVRFYPQPDSVRALADLLYPGHFETSVLHFTTTLDPLIQASCAYGRIPIVQVTWEPFVEEMFGREHDAVAEVFGKCVSACLKVFPEDPQEFKAPTAAIVVRRVRMESPSGP